MDTANENTEPATENTENTDSADEENTNTAAHTVANATTWLDDKLVPILGTAPLGPYELDERDDPDPGVADELCPVCHHAVSRHEIEVDPVSHHTYRICPGTGTAYEIDTHEHVAEPGTVNGPVLS